MSDAVFLHETEAAVVLFDLAGYTRLAAALAPLELGLALSRYYAHAEACIEGAGGRLVKFAGDAVLGAWLAHETARPRAQAIAAVAGARANRLDGLDYTVAAAHGPVLAGQIGTQRHKSFDVLGEAVNAAFKLAAAAQARSVDHLIAIPGDDLVEVEGIELGGKLYRLYRLGEET